MSEIQPIITKKELKEFRDMLYRINTLIRAQTLASENGTPEQFLSLIEDIDPDRHRRVIQFIKSEYQEAMKEACQKIEVTVPDAFTPDPEQ